MMQGEVQLTGFKLFGDVIEALERNAGMSIPRTNENRSDFIYLFASVFDLDGEGCAVCGS